MTNTPEWRRLHWMSELMFSKALQVQKTSQAPYTLGGLLSDSSKIRKAPKRIALQQSRGVQQHSGETGGKTGSRCLDVCNFSPRRRSQEDCWETATGAAGDPRNLPTNATAFQVLALGAYLYSGLYCAFLNELRSLVSQVDSSV
ncbi:hypothetical protein K443DRAFT_469319 [Laccaria amethystina LaAM-08-1]|uniref:Uncharacterized protein n=1 Tax=Laccaria amethystina LaAM-08-1 TaxID=1095629 RepID=A0A0C9Y6E0_9AGAR|nr:hypothetical protein K443DRAFT_469319 [Laccaria amethystina LaAM-08-1]